MCPRGADSEKINLVKDEYWLYSCDPGPPDPQLVALTAGIQGYAVDDDHLNRQAGEENKLTEQRMGGSE